MASNRRLYVYQYPEGGDGGAGGTGGAGGGGTGGEPAFPDAAAARTFLNDYVSEPDLIKGVPDDKIVPWATHLKSKVDEFGKQIPPTWRQIVAGDNPEHLKTLERFQSPKALYESYAALRGKMSSGELRQISPFPEKGTPEQQAAWRAENGIPLEPKGDKGYKLALPDGVVLGDDDKEVVDHFADAAHAAHMRPEHFNATVAWYLQERAARMEKRTEQDTEFRMSSEDKLRAEWQGDYRANVARISAMLDQAPQGVKDLVAGARAHDGTIIGDHPEVLRWLADVARQLNPAGVIIPAAGGNQASSIEDEIKQIEEVMEKDRAKYNKDEKMQARLRELYTARDTLKQRGAGGAK